MSVELVIPVVGTDLVPDGWAESHVEPWLEMSDDAWLRALTDEQFADLNRRWFLEHDEERDDMSSRGLGSVRAETVVRDQRRQ